MPSALLEENSVFQNLVDDECWVLILCECGDVLAFTIEKYTPHGWTWITGGDTCLWVCSLAEGVRPIFESTPITLVSHHERINGNVPGSSRWTMNGEKSGDTDSVLDR